MAPDPTVSGAPIVEEYRQPYHEYVAPDPTVSGAPIVEEYRQPYHEYMAPDPTVSGAPIVEERRNTDSPITSTWLLTPLFQVPQ